MGDFLGYLGVAAVVGVLLFGLRSCHLGQDRMRHCQKISTTPKDFSICLGDEHSWDVKKFYSTKDK